MRELQCFDGSNTASYIEQGECDIHVVLSTERQIIHVRGDEESWKLKYYRIGHFVDELISSDPPLKCTQPQTWPE